MKRCFKCGTNKPLSEFYAHPMMADGHLGKCKDCTKLDVKTDRATNPRVRAYDRERSKLPKRAALRSRVLKDWRAKFPERASAIQKATYAARSGKLVAPSLCEGCGLSKKLSKHHHDYSRPLAVVWLCKPCHAIADKLRRRLESA